jgi:hypothetical protein
MVAAGVVHMVILLVSNVQKMHICTYFTVFYTHRVYMYRFCSFLYTLQYRKPLFMLYLLYAVF